MAPTLVRLAAVADDDASALQVFLDGIPKHDNDVASSIQYLLDVAGALRAVDNAIRTEFGHPSHLPESLQLDIDLVLRSFSQTHEKLDKNLFQQTRQRAFGGRIPFKLLWDELDEQLTSEGSPLYSRLELYSTFLQNVLHAIERRAINPERTQSLRSRLSRLLNLQNPLADRSRRLSVGGDPLLGGTIINGGTRDRPVPFMTRPALTHFSSYPSTAAAAPALVRPWYEVPPPAPEIPASPTFSQESEHTSWSSGSPNSDESQGHWAMRIFDRPTALTYFSDPGAPTRCYGRVDLAAREQLRSEQYLEVLRLSFPDTNHHCRFFWRPLDHRARILVSRRDGQGRTAHYCCPLTALKLIRQASRLLLNRYDPYDRQYAIWANLRFPTYEHQALFYCAFVALKRQDREPSPPRLDDYFPGEAVVFSGEIEDDSYLHWLRVLRDADTDAVRLEASPRRGPMVGVPIWTAFVGEYVGARRWLRRISNNVIELESLRPYVFCHSYRPPRVQGRFRLNFTTREDAENFKHQFQLL